MLSPAEGCRKDVSLQPALKELSEQEIVLVHWQNSSGFFDVSVAAA